MHNKFIRISLFVCVLSACAASGTQVKEEQLSGFQKGKTTQQDVIQALGQPQNRTVLSNGSSMIVYSYAQVQTRPETFIPFVGAFVGGADTKTNSVVFTFDEEGKLKNYTSSAGATGTGMGLASGTGVPERVADQPKQSDGSTPQTSPPSSVSVPQSAKARMGADFVPLTAAMADRLKVPGGAGVVVSSVNPGTPAEQSGIRAGDIITVIAGRPVVSVDVIQDAIKDIVPGTKAELVVVRAGKESPLSVQF